MSRKALTKSFLFTECEKFKEKSLFYFNKGKYNKSLKTARFAARIAYHFPILYNFVDDELEIILCNISKEVLKNCNVADNKKLEKRIIFYNSQIIDSGQLTEQFLNYFIENNYNVLFIIPNQKTLFNGKRILKTISENPNIELYVLKEGSYTEKIKHIYKKIVNYSASKAFLQFTPDDVIGFSVFCRIANIKKYFVDITCQSFGLGKNCSDFYIEIFNKGFLIARERRKIAENKMIFLPIYAINDNNKFEGFPFIKENKIVGLSGGQLYKYLVDPELKYFHVIKDLIEKYPNFIFCLAGSGSDNTLIKKFINKYKLENRFFLLGQRKDFYALVKNSDIYFESYPIKGGLTPLFAIENKKPIIGLANRNNATGGLENVLNMSNFKQSDNLEDFFLEAESLITSKAEGEKNVRKFQECKYTKERFNLILDNIFSNKQMATDSFKNQKLNYNDELALNEYLSNKNAYFNYYLEKIYFVWNCISVKEFLDASIKIIQSGFVSLIKMIFTQYLIKIITFFYVKKQHI